MRWATEDESVQIFVVLFVSEHFEPFLEIDCPHPEYNEAVLYITSRFEIIIIIPLDGLAVDIFKRFHAFLVALEGVFVSKPGYVA